MPPLLLPYFPLPTSSTQDKIAAKTEDLNTIIYKKLDTGSLQGSANTTFTSSTPKYEFNGKLIIVFAFVGGCMVVVGLLIAYVLSFTTGS